MSRLSRAIALLLLFGFWTYTAKAEPPDRNVISVEAILRSIRLHPGILAQQFGPAVTRPQFRDVTGAWVDISASNPLPVTMAQGGGSNCGTTAPAHTYCGNNTGSSATAAYVSLVAADLPGSITSSTSGNAATSTAFASTPSLCTAGQAAIGINTLGNAQGCFTPGGLANPMTTLGDIIYGASSGTPTRLGANSTAIGQFLYSISSAVPVWRTPVLSDIASSSSGNAYILTGSFASTGTTLANSITANIINGVYYVGAGTTWAGADIGAQLNTVIAACPSGAPNTGCHIKVVAGVYNFSTPVVVSANKPIQIECDPGAATNGVPEFGVTLLNYTAASGSAFTFSDVSTGSGMIGCILRGPNSGTSVGLAFAATQVYGGKFSDIDISQFNVGIQWPSGAGSIATRFDNMQVHDNITNNLLLQSGAGAESMTFNGGSIYTKSSSFSTTCISITGVPLTAITFSNMSIDQCGVTVSYTGTNGTIISFLKVHFENPNGSTASAFLAVSGAGTGGVISLEDCDMEEDSTSARTEFITISNASHLQITDGWYSAFATTAQMVNATSNSADISLKTATALNFTNPVNTTFTGPLLVQEQGSGAVSATTGTMYWGGPSGASNLSQWQHAAGQTVSGVNTTDFGEALSGTGWHLAFDTTGNLGISGKIAVGAGATPGVAGTGDIGATALPFGNLWLGTAATNNFKFQPAATSGARVITIADPSSPTTVALPLTIANGTSAMTTAGIATGACGTTVTTAATGVLTTDAIEISRNAAPTNANGGNLILNWWPTAGNVNFNYCNPSAGTVTPTAMTINWRVIR